MNRILLRLVCCSPLILNVLTVQSVDLIGPNGESRLVQDVEIYQAPLSSAQYGPITSSETLWSISTKLRPNNVSVYQTLLAIYKLNPSAFYQGNINKIIPSSVIKIPSDAFIAQQTNKEAEQLLRPAQKTPIKKVEKPVVAIKEVVKPVVVEPVVAEPAVIEQIQAIELPAIDPTIVEGLKKEVLDKESALENSSKKLQVQEKEFELLSEQLIVVTEANQRLKLKLQPLTDQINTLADQVEQDIITQQELQALIDQYRLQIEAFVAPPFSGPGIINEILSVVTSSISSLLLTILSPLLLVIALFMIFLRLKYKRELDEREQEIAESTSTLMEEDGQFDSLLTDDLDEQENSDELSSEIDFTDNLETDEIMHGDETAEDDIELDIVDDGSELIDQDVLLDDSIDDSELINEGADPSDGAEDFDIDALIDGKVEEIELSEDDFPSDTEANQADLDLAAEWEAQLNQESGEASSEVIDDIDISLDTEMPDEAIDDVDDVDDIDALVDNEAVNEAVAEALPETDDIDALLDAQTATEAEPATDDIDALLDAQTATEAEPATDDIDALLDAQTATEAEPATDDIDALLDAQTATEALPEADDIDALLDAQTTTEALPETDDIDALLEEEIATEAKPATEDIDALLEEEIATEAEPATDNIDALLEEEIATEVEPATDDIDALLDEEIATEADPKTDDIDAVLDAEATNEVINDVDSVTEDDIDDLSEFENIDLSTLKSVDQTISELDAESEALGAAVSDEVISEPESIDNADSTDKSEKNQQSLAEQLSNGAFNEDVPLPSIDKNDEGDFIDIDTLLTGSGGEELSEEEFNLEFGLEEFPDVVESFTEFDSDDDGVAAQLDLARAYLEIDEKDGAKSILTKLLESAQDDKLKEVQKLLDRIS